MPEINKVFRRIRNLPLYIKKDGTISSAIYSDSKGVSVDIDDNRNIEDIVLDEERLHILYNGEKIEVDPEGPYKLIAIASTGKINCDEKNVCIELAPIEGENDFHAILKGAENRILLSPGQRKHLVRNTAIIKTYDEKVVKI